MRPSRLQSRNRPISPFLSLSNFDLKPFTDFADTVSWSSTFQRLTTLSEKKCMTTHFAVATMFDQFKWMTTGSIVSVQFKEFGQQYWWEILCISKNSMRYERFLLSSRVHRFSLCRHSMYVSLLASLISLLQDCDIYSHKKPWCALLTAVKNYNKSLEILLDFFFKTEWMNWMVTKLKYIKM